MKKIKRELDNFSDTLKNISDQRVFEQLKQRIIVLLSNNSEVETSKNDRYDMLNNPLFSGQWWF